MNIGELLKFTTKPIERQLEGGRCIKYTSNLKRGTTETQLFDKNGTCYFTRTSKVLKDKSNNTITRRISEESKITENINGEPIRPLPDVYYTHIQRKRFYSPQKELLNKQQLEETGYVGTSSNGKNYFRIFNDIIFKSQKPNGAANEIIGEPIVSSQYLNKIDTTPTIWNV